MNLNSRCGGNRPARASIAAAVTSAPAVATPSIAAAAIASAVIAGMAVAPEPAIAAAFAAGRTIRARSTALIFAALVSQHEPANKNRAGDDDARQ